MAFQYGLTIESFTAAFEEVMSDAIILAVFDDDNDGTADVEPLTRLALNAISYVEGFVRRVYSLQQIRDMAEPPNELIRLILERAQAVALCRHPEVQRVNGKELRDQNRKELIDLAEGRTRFDVDGTPEPAANEGGTVRSGDPNCPAPKPKFFADGTGLF